MDADKVQQKAETFASLHRVGDPVVLFNCWDVATAKLAARAFPAVATSSGAVAMAQGFEDGERIPLDLVLSLMARIAGAVDCPVSVDLEAGYSDDPLEVAGTVERLIDSGIVGINLEDGLSQGRRALVAPDAHARKIEAVREVAERAGGPFFINARIDTFLLKIGDAQTCFDETLNRAAAYAAAGASGIFVPFLFDTDLIADLAARIALPLNILVMPTAAPVAALAKAGVARISCGAWPIEAFAQAFGAAAAAFADTKDYASVLAP